MSSSPITLPLRKELGPFSQSAQEAAREAREREEAKPLAEASADAGADAGTGASPELWFLDDAPIHGGGQRFALKLAIAAAARDPAIRCVIVCPEGSELSSRSREAGFETRNAEFPSVAPPSRRSPLAVLALRRLLAGAPKEAILVANSPRTQAYAAAALVLCQHAPAVVNVVHEQDTAARRVARTALRHGGRVVAIGANTARVYERALPGVRVRKINNVLDDFELEAAGRARARALRLAVLARMIPEKGLVELLEEAATSSSHWSTLAIGAPPQDRAYEGRVRQRIEELGLAGRAHLLGGVVDVPRFLDAADVLVVPSTGFEGQPTAIIEALARGLPVLVREPILSEDFNGMPVRSYRNAHDFGAALSALRPSLASVEEMRRRFGVDQAIDGLLAAAA
jgi:glycosyltransferase involved in cell wall biosynthesis